MKTHIFPLILAALFFLNINAYAQIADGSIAPNFTSTDIEGNEWELYEVLNQGKTVILDISATWCAPCWNYHESGALHELYEMYGPNGSDEYMVFLIEGDELTTLDHLYGIGSGTLGNWVEGTPYPIFDDRDIAEAFQINFFPSLFMVCPTRKVYQIGQWTAEEIHDFGDICPQAMGENNASILAYSGFEGLICEDVNFPPAISMQNMGSEPLTAAHIILKRDNDIIQEMEWTGNLPTYNVAEIIFDPILVTGNTELSIDIENVNGGTDDDISNNNYMASIEVSTFTDHERVNLELQLDNIPGETYWEITNANGEVIYYAGNESAKDSDASNEERYQTPNELIDIELWLPSDGCYAFGIYDSFGDGLANGAYYRLKGADGNTILEGGNFNFEEITPFGIVGAVGTSDNATLLFMEPLANDFCFDYTFSPTIEIQNTGNNEITEIELSVAGENENYLNYTWNGNLESAKIENISLPEITINSSDDIFIEIISVNGQPHEFGFRNTVSRPSLRRATTVQDWVIEMYTGNDAHEIYWQITDDDDNVIISGGNEIVGPDGGGLEVAQPSDPGAYGDDSQVVENINLSAYGCYHLKLVDDVGNGLTGGGFGVPNPFFKIRNNTVGIIVETNGNYGVEFNSNIGVESFNSDSEILSGKYNLKIQPNPASDELSLFLENMGAAEIELFIAESVTGRIVWENTVYGIGEEMAYPISVAHLPSGLYMIGVIADGKTIMEKFVVGR